MVPPIIAPVFPLPPEAGASLASFVDVAVPEFVAEAVPVVEEAASDVEEAVPDVEELSVVVVEVFEVVVSEVLLDPIVVAWESVVGFAVRAALRLFRLIADFPAALIATVAAMSEAEPHPYWKNPPSNWFL